MIQVEAMLHEVIQGETPAGCQQVNHVVSLGVIWEVLQPHVAGA